MLFYLKQLFYLSFLVYHINLSFLQNLQYHFCLLNLLLLILQKNVLTLSYQISNIFIMIMIIGNFFSSSLFSSSFLTKLLTLYILFSTATKTVVIK